MSKTSYVGKELDVFSHARNWKAYVRACLGPWVRGDVLEVGAGIGSTTRVLCDGTQRSWVCLEPDLELARRLHEKATCDPFPIPVSVEAYLLRDMEPARAFDTILYIDVLEHVAKDREELEVARGHLREGGALVVLSPAFQFLYSTFDRAVGHNRRYDKACLHAIMPPGLRRERLRYLDSVGMLASLVNRVFLKQDVPSLEQIRIWDRILVRASRWIDPLCFYAFGRSVISVYTYTNPGDYMGGSGYDRPVQGPTFPDRSPAGALLPTDDRGLSG